MRYRKVTFKDGSVSHIADIPGKIEIEVSRHVPITATDQVTLAELRQHINEAKQGGYKS